MSRAQLTSTVEQNTGGAISPVVAGKNGVINGGFDIWQRGTTITGSLYGYSTADRWFMTSTGSMTTAQESTTVPAGSRYSMKTTCGGSSATIAGYQAIETYNALQFAGKTVTFSGYFQSSATPTVQLYVEYSTTVDAALTSTWTSATSVSGGSGAAGASSFARVSGVWTIPSTAQSIRVWWQVPLSASQVVYTGQIQLELGSVATPFSRAAGTFQGELALCQRYYYRCNGALVASNYSSYSSTSIGFTLPIPVTMRVTPTTSTTITNSNCAGSGVAPSTNQWGMTVFGLIWATKSGTVYISTYANYDGGVTNNISVSIVGGTWSGPPNGIGVDSGLYFDASAEL